MTSRSAATLSPLDQGPSTLKPMAGTTSRATRSSGRQAPDSLAGDTRCEHAEHGPTNNTVSAPHQPAASGAPAHGLSPEALAFAMLLAQAAYAHILQTRQAAGQPVPPSSAGPQPAAPAAGAASPRPPAGAGLTQAPAGAGGVVEVAAA